MSKPTAKALRFARLVASGESQAQALRIAYNRTGKPRTIALDACRLAARPEIKAEIERLRGRSEVKILLTLNDRLAILAEIAQDTRAKKNERTRAIDVYSRISGDQAPSRVDLSSPPGQPLQVQEVAPAGLRASPADKIKSLLKRREEFKAAGAQ